MLRLMAVEFPDRGDGGETIALGYKGGKVSASPWDGAGSRVQLREATPADVSAAFLAQCEADGRAEKVRGVLAQWGGESNMDFSARIMNFSARMGLRSGLEALDLSALLEPEAGNEEGEPCED